MLEAGCGVGNCIFPLLEEDLNIFIYACDFSPRAVQFVKVSGKSYANISFMPSVATVFCVAWLDGGITTTTTVFINC